jgi:hypothetical protein
MELTSTHSNFTQDKPHSKEARALRLFMALEAAATHPEESGLTAKDISAMLQNLHRWLLLEPKETKRPHDPGTGDKPFPEQGNTGQEKQ